MKEELTRIALALERIADSLTQPSKPVRSRKVSIRKSPEGAQSAIATYCDAFKTRYGTMPIIDGKSAGLTTNLLKVVPLEKLNSLIQAYLQMEDPWFKTRCHDFQTFHQNIGKVAVALANGTNDPHEANYWRKVFGEENLRITNNQNDSNLGGEALPHRTSNSLLAGPPERF